MQHSNFSACAALNRSRELPCDLLRFHEPFLSLHSPGEPGECAQINQSQPCWIVTGLSRYHELDEGGSTDKNPDHSGNQGQPMSYPPTGAFCPPAHQQHAQQIHSCHAAEGKEGDGDEIAQEKQVHQDDEGSNERCESYRPQTGCWTQRIA